MHMNMNFIRWLAVYLLALDLLVLFGSSFRYVPYSRENNDIFEDCAFLRYRLRGVIIIMG